MDLMKGKFFTVPRVLVSIITVLITSVSFFVFGSLADSLFGDADTLGAIIFVMPALFIVEGGSGLTYFLVRVFLGKVYLDESIERSIIFGITEILVWATLVLFVLFLVLG